MAVTFINSSQGALSVAYVNSSGGNLNYLSSYGMTVTYINNPSSLTLAQLSGFDAVVVASNGQFSNPSGVGNAVADFADLGKRVVLAEFDFQGVWSLSGRIMTAGYSPFTTDPSSGGYANGSPGIPLGTLYDPFSPLLSGAGSAHSQYTANVGLSSGSVLVADWANGRHAVAFSGGTGVVGLNLFPGGDYGLDTGSQRLVANALTFEIAPVPEPSTYIAGALLLLPFGAQLIHRLRSPKQTV